MPRSGWEPRPASSSTELLKSEKHPGKGLPGAAPTLGEPPPGSYFCPHILDSGREGATLARDTEASWVSNTWLGPGKFRRKKNNSFVIVRVMCVWTVALAATLLKKLTLRTLEAFLDRLLPPLSNSFIPHLLFRGGGWGLFIFFVYLSCLFVNLLWEWWGDTFSFADFCRALLPDPFWNPSWFISINRATGSLIVYICWFDWRLNRGSNHRRIPGAASCRCVTRSSVFWGGGCHQNLAYSALSITSLCL